MGQLIYANAICVERARAAGRQSQGRRRRRGAGAVCEKRLAGFIVLAVVGVFIISSSSSSDCAFAIAYPRPPWGL